MRQHLHLTLIEVSEPKILETIIVAGSLGAWIVHRPSPTLLLVDIEHADRVLEVIRRTGHRPRVIDR